MILNPCCTREVVEQVGIGYDDYKKKFVELLLELRKGEKFEFVNPPNRRRKYHVGDELWVGLN